MYSVPGITCALQGHLPEVSHRKTFYLSASFLGVSVSAGMGVFHQPAEPPQQPVVQPQQQFNSWAQPGQAPPTDYTLGTQGQLWSRLPSEGAGFGSVTQQHGYPAISPAQPRQQQQLPPVQESPFTPGHGWAGFQSAPQASREPVVSEPYVPFAQRLQQVEPGLVTGPRLPASPANAGKDAGR
jgi:hypothetical protein